MTLIADRVYSVRAGKGYMQITVTQQAIDYYSERRAVARIAWQKLMGVNSLDEVIQKRSPTRAYIASMANATLNAYDELFDQFMHKIEYTFVDLSWREDK